MLKKIMVVTTGRADYGLLCPLIKRLVEFQKHELQLIATGTHLSQMHGNTIDFILADGFKVSDTVEMTMGSDSEGAVCSSISLGLIGFSKVVQKLCPDLVIVLGDRYELFSVCIAAVIHKVPIAHIHGGEATFGVIDDPIRHSVTKMSTFHFPSMDLYAKRIIQMGERPEHVFVVGALGVDNIKQMNLMTKDELSDFTGVDFINKQIALMTYHPVTLDSYDSAEYQIKEVLNSLVKTDLFTIVTMPNSDPSGNAIYKILDRYCREFPDKFKLVKSLGQRAYLSAQQHVQLMIGNSSSGILESASFKLPVVNIGDRQAGRFKPENVVDCECTEEAISGAINHALSDSFKQSISLLQSPYGDGKAAAKIVEVLESLDLNNKTKLLKKGFYDIHEN